MIFYKVVYIAASLIVTALARPGPPAGTYYANINPQGTVCVQVNWPPNRHEDVQLGVKCGAHFKKSKDITVDEGPPSVYVTDSDSKPNYRRFRQVVNVYCGLRTILPGDLYKFVYKRVDKTIVTAFHGQGVMLRPGHC
ncbi:hypothetical protein FOZ60_005149 [Perkinsus olseni]|uniref:Uncharacterized protein n=2 Tax=Perkinsus olseni TaxID=32597 RepID=A0A7J6PGE0_PEROL|nr:hypothetical protein FOZ60_005149 [Perkinsus olseni]